MMNLAKGLIKLGCNVSIVGGYIDDTHTNRYIESCRDFKFYLIKLPRTTSPFFRGFRLVQKAAGQIIRAHREMNFDLIHLHVGYAQLAVVPLLTAKLLGIPVLFTCYFPPSRYVLGRKNPILNPFITRLSISAATKIIAVSRNTENSLEKIGVNTGKVIRRPPPVDFVRFNPDSDGHTARKKVGVSEKEKVILFAGNFTKSKGLDILLKALETVLQKHQEARLVYMRQVKFEEFGDRTREIENILSSFPDRKRCLAVDNLDFHELLPMADLFITPFRDTCGPVDYPLTLLEAMASGKPVIASNVGGIPEIVEHRKTGLLVNSGDIETLRDAISFALEHEREMAEIGRNAYELIKKTCDSNLVSENILEDYKTVLQNGRDL